MGRTSISRDELSVFLRSTRPSFKARDFSMRSKSSIDFAREAAAFLTGGGIPEHVTVPVNMLDANQDSVTLLLTTRHILAALGHAADFPRGGRPFGAT